MRPFRIPEVFLGALLAVALFTFGFAVAQSFYPSHQNQQTKSGEKIANSTLPDDRLADYTLALDVLNGFLVLSTVLLWWATRRSAKVAERALTELEAPFLSIKINAPGLEIKGHNVTFGILRWCVANYGRTPATILEVFDDTRATKIGTGLPPAIDPQDANGTPMPYGVIAPPAGQSEDFPFLAVRELVPGTSGDEVPFSEKSLFFIGFVRYSDILRNRFVLGFCFVFDRQGSRWILAGGARYNYCRKERGGVAPDWYQPTADTGSIRADLYRAIRNSED